MQKSKPDLRKAITWEPEAQVQVRAIDREQALRILHGIDHYLRTEDGDVKRLQGIRPAEYRLRVGDYRVRFYNRMDSIHILAVKHRREAYR